MFSLIYNTENIYISQKPKVLICNVKQIKIVAKIYLWQSNYYSKHNSCSNCLTSRIRELDTFAYVYNVLLHKYNSVVHLDKWIMG